MTALLLTERSDSRPLLEYGQVHTSNIAESWPQSACPLWVRSRHVQRTSSCPLYPRKRHQMRHSGMSALGQKRTSRNHSINSSAREMSAGGTVSPSVLAVLRL